MTLKQASALLDTAPANDTPSAINPYLTQRQAVEMVRAALPTLDMPKGKVRAPDDQVPAMIEKRVYQVTQNRKNPRY